jgi:glucose/arabinose dehydrogenase
MKPETTPTDTKTDDDKRFRKQLALLSLPILLIILLVLAISYFTKHNQPAGQSTAPPAPAPAINLPKIKLSLFAKNLPNTTAIVSKPNDSRLYVLDQSGIIRSVLADGAVQKAPFLDISNRVKFGGEMGLLGLAFSPNFSSDGYLFVNYIDKNQNTVISRFSSSAGKPVASSEQKVLSLAQPYANHNGGALLFGPDGYLYAALGDGGSHGDPQNRAQNTNGLLGKILRLDVSRLPYAIPQSNPFVGQAGKRAEIWDFGLRNPWRISIDRQTHELYIADVGQGDYEEINIEPAGKGGANYGWRCYEGLHAYELGGCAPKNSFKFPALEYDHSQDRCSITGGYVYRGHKYSSLIGKYLYGDYCGGQLYWAQPKDGKLNPTLGIDTSYKISTFGEDSQGELYLADYATGRIFHIEG